MYNDETRRKELIRKITALLKTQDVETLEDVYAQTRKR